MARVRVEPKSADYVKLLVRMAVENELKVLRTDTTAFHISLYWSSK